MLGLLDHAAAARLVAGWTLNASKRSNQQQAHAAAPDLSFPFWPVPINARRRETNRSVLAVRIKPKAIQISFAFPYFLMNLLFNARYVQVQGKPPQISDQIYSYVLANRLQE